MKAIQYILTVAALMLCLTIHAQVQWDVPQQEWKSTSTMVGSGSSLPMAAQNGVITTANNTDSYESSNNGHHGGIRRVNKDDDIGDPGALPIGGGVVVLSIFAAAYAVTKRKKTNEIS